MNYDEYNMIGITVYKILKTHNYNRTNTIPK